jgi:hypothetical protein
MSNEPSGVGKPAGKGRGPPDGDTPPSNFFGNRRLRNVLDYIHTIRRPDLLRPISKRLDQGVGVTSSCIDELLSAPVRPGGWNLISGGTTVWMIGLGRGGCVQRVLISHLENSLL